MGRNSEVNNLVSCFVTSESPGMQYVVVDKDSTLFENTAGLSDVLKKEPMSLTNTMTAFSMTKTITAIAILQLVEQGKVALDEKALKYVEHPYNSEITIAQLINHTSGIKNPIPLKWAHLAKDHKTFNEKEELDKVLSEHPDLDFDPGEKYLYSNIGYWLLGGVIEKVSGQSYTEYVNDNIFSYLELSQESIGYTIKNYEKHAKGYIKKWSFMNFMGKFFMDKGLYGNDEGSWVHINTCYLNGPAFGGSLGTARAFSRILQDLLSANSKLLNSKTKKLLYEHQSTNSGKEIDMTLGWHIGKLDNINCYYKEGGGAGFRCEMRIYPEKGIGTVLMLNRTSFKFKKDMSKLDKLFVKN